MRLETQCEQGHAAVSGSCAIETTGLTKRYGDTVAVDGLDLRVPAGAVYGFLGPNGAGKTTTIRLLTGLITPDEGEVFLAGEQVTDTDSVVNLVGYAPSDPPVYDLLTGREQLQYVARLKNIDDAATRIDGLLDRFDLADAADDRIETYSTGMRQKVGVIQSLVHDPSVLLLDEPTNGLDPRSSREMRRLLREVAGDGQTVFLSTHTLSVVDDLAETVGVLYDGQLVAEDAPSALKREQGGDGAGTLEDAFIEITTEEP